MLGGLACAGLLSLAAPAIAGDRVSDTRVGPTRARVFVCTDRRHSCTARARFARSHTRLLTSGGVRSALAGLPVAAIAAVAAVAAPTTTTALTTYPTSPVADQTVIVIATVTSSDPASPPSGSVTVESNGIIIDGCSGLPVSPTGPSVSVSCVTGFIASAVTLVASFTPDGTTAAGASSSTPADLVVGQAPSTISVSVSLPAQIGTPTTYTADVLPAAGNTQPTQPFGNVTFLDGGTPIAGCRYEAVIKEQATCLVTYTTLGRHQISATYSGNSDFAPATAPTVPVTVTPIPAVGFVNAYMSWTFFFTPSYTIVKSMVISGVQAGMSVALACTGPGCGFARRRVAPRTARACARRSGHPCRVAAMLDLTSTVGGRHLRVGAQLSVSISHPGWLGKYYRFTIRAAHEPRVAQACLAVNGIRPGADCSTG